MRCLLVGDCHIKDNEHLDDTKRCLQFVVETAIARDVDAVLFGGDLFNHKSSPAERLVLRDTLLNLSVPVLLVRGNHEPLGDLAVFSGYEGVTVAEQPSVVALDNVDVLAIPWPEKAWLAARGWTGETGDQAGQHALGDMVRAMAATRSDPSRPLIVVGHLAVGGAVASSGQPLIGRSLEMALGDLTDLGAVFTALSHIHRPQELAPTVFYIGSLNCVDFGEEDEAKRVVLLTVHDDGTAEWESIPVPCRKWVTVEACLEELDEDVLGHRLERVRGQAWDDELEPGRFRGMNVRYTYEVPEEYAAKFDHAEIERRFAAAHTLKIVPVVERAARVRAAEVAEAKTVADKLAAWGAATDTPITSGAVEKLNTLQEEVNG
ncbi:MAG: metallophosphoesterase [Acidobacteria bacterium]|nr:metallophosphoesterase [Acidobacteriota bacterium]